MTTDIELPDEILITWRDGKVLNIMDIPLERVKIEDIAASLAQQARWGGHCPWPFSVAKHSVHCARDARRRLETRGMQYQCLMHDITEAFVGDMMGTIKKVCPMFQAIEARVWEQLHVHFGLPAVLDTEVHVYDKADMEQERALMGSPRRLGPDWVADADLFLCEYARYADVRKCAQGGL